MTKRAIIIIITLILVTSCWNTSVMASQSIANSTYTVRSGDCLWTIGNRFGVSVSQLKALNGLRSNFIRVGQVLKISQASNITSRSYTISRSGDTLDRVSNIIVSIAARYLGAPYVWGGCSPSGFDCSGFVKYVMSQVGTNIPRTAASQFNCGAPVNKSELKPGDLVFFRFTHSGIDHVGIYVGGGSFIHSSCPRDGGVIYSSLYTAYYASGYAGARRVAR